MPVSVSIYPRQLCGFLFEEVLMETRIECTLKPLIIGKIRNALVFHPFRNTHAYIFIFVSLKCNISERYILVHCTSGNRSLLSTQIHG